MFTFFLLWRSFSAWTSPELILSLQKGFHLCTETRIVNLTINPCWEMGWWEAQAQQQAGTESEGERYTSRSCAEGQGQANGSGDVAQDLPALLLQRLGASEESEVPVLLPGSPAPGKPCLSVLMHMAMVQHPSYEALASSFWCWREVQWESLSRTGQFRAFSRWKHLHPC